MKDIHSIVGIGSPIIDSIAQVPEAFLDSVDGDKGGMVLTEGATIDRLIASLPESPTPAPGGSSGNALFGLARMGVASKFLGKVGNCSRGQFYRERFAELGGDPSRLKIGTQPNGHCLSLVTPDGERTMRTDLGAAMTLTPDEVSVDDFAGCDHAHIEGYLLFNEALMAKVLECAKAAGCQISLDLASFEVVHAAKATLPKILEEYVDIVFANEEEGEAYTGISSDYPAMANELATMCEVAAVKVGADGSYIASNGEVDKVAAVSVDHVVDTTAAGDLWAAGFLYGLTQKLPLSECARIGSMLGAAVVQEQGSVLPEKKWEEILSNI